MISIRTIALSAMASAVFGMVGCSAEQAKPPETPGQKVEIQIAPLKLAGITEGIWSIVVTNGDNEEVWSRTELRSTRFGDSKGSISYVGPCDAQSNPNRVTIDGLLLFDENGPLDPDSWQNPLPVALDVFCQENADVPVTFNIVIMRDANQGFFDIAVSFDSIYCSSKLDCNTEVLFDAEGERARTIVMGLACAADGGRPVFLHINDIQIVCDGGTTWFDPSGPEGNNGAMAPLLFQTGIYRGESFLANADVNSTYWNNAFGLIEGPDAINCRLLATATASVDSWPSGLSPEATTYPYVLWDVQLTDETGQLVCSEHPLNGTPTGVSTGYTEITSMSFTHEATSTGIITTNRQVLCGNINFEGTDMAVAFTSEAGEVVLSVGGTTTAGYALPAGKSLARTCCTNGCCQ